MQINHLPYIADFWVAKKKLYNEFASSRNFDPLIPENWYKQTRADISAFEV